MREHKNFKLLIAFIICILFVPFASAQDTANKTLKKGNVGGYLITQREIVDESYNAGYSMYVTAYPLLREYPGREFQSGLFGTWMHPQYDAPLPVEKLYTDIEGGLGWWRDTEYATATPKFIMGGVQRDFVGWANGPGAGQGRDWNNPKGKYGIAQLSPWILWPPDGLNLKQGTCGKLFGSGYLPLPLTEPKSTTAGKNVSTGNQCWTLFLNTANFKGPVAFFTPYFWTKASAEDTRLDGLFLDQRPSKANKPFQMETQHIHSYEATDSKGQRYARMAPTQYAAGQDGNSNLLHRLMVYNKKALWDDVEAWFNGGEPSDGKIDVQEAAQQKFKKGIRSNWKFYGDHIPKDKRALMNITDYMDQNVADAATLSVRWDGDLITKKETKNGYVITLPEYYKFVKIGNDSIGEWIAVTPESVPAETGLHDVDFSNKVPRNKTAYVTPDEEVSCWKTPGPAAGPFKTKLGDGSTVTYYWYRFADQPALLNADMTKEEREEMQRRVEMLHRNWTKEREYLPSPLIGELADIDPALIMTPPKGLEIGYVPIVTQQGIEKDSSDDRKVGVVKQHYQGLHGYIGYSASHPADQMEFSYGMGFYSAVWPLIDKPLDRFQIGLASAWLTPNNADNKDKPLAPIGTYARDNWPKRGPTWGSVFQTIEGGLGYWAGNRFRYGPPKFSMNSTPQCYDYEIGSPGWSFFYDTEALPDDRLGIAQLSNTLLIPPDALPFQGNPNGKFFGCTYLALPFTEPTTGDPPTGDQSWTCFLNTANFKGPIAYFIPETWSKTGKIFDHPFIYGRGLDARPGNMGGGAMEINTVPCFESHDQEGNTYSKIPQLQFPVDDEGNTLLVQDVTYYSKEALYNSFKEWRNGGAACTGKINKKGAWKSTLTTRSTSYDQAGKSMSGINDVFDTKVHGNNIWGLEWFDGSKNNLGKFPQYFKHVGDSLIAISEAEVPGETNLLTTEFKLARAGDPFTSPGKGAWANPGPEAGPFEVELTDGSIVTYYWYRFVDQPSFQQYDFPEDKKEKLQALVEKIHRDWPIDRDYMAPPTKGELATFDPALLVTPPKGLEYGYVPIVTNQRKAEPKAHWTFDEKSDSIQGKHRMAKGVKGQAVVMDGYTTRIEIPSIQVPKLEESFTIEAWIAVGAYPWNWAPIAAQENTVSLNSNLDEITWPEDIISDSPIKGFFFGISPQGHLGLHIGNGEWRICKSENKIPFREWTHVAASYDKHDGVALYINGKKVGVMDVDSGFEQAMLEELRIGMPRQKIEASNPVRAFATLPSWYSFDGILDEIQVHKESLSSEEIAKKYSSITPASVPDLPLRVMPSGPKGSGKFGASYTHLKYHPEWDAQWRLGSDPDVVVQFDDSPVRVVFWRGTRYGPAWVMENDMWMGDQSIENFNGKDGCMEHMLDPRCRFSHVRIIENTPARVVVHWRYLPTSANGNHSQVNPISGWEDWVDEYYTFYPDGTGMRKVVLHSDGASLWPEEVIAFCQPGQRPEDVVELKAMTLANLKGEQHTYSWAEKSPKFRNKSRWELGGYIHFGDELGEKPNIMMVNMKSEYKPFQIFELECNFTCFAHEHRKDVSHFPWWNHWPAAMIPSDGRYCQAADRPSHFSLAWGTPVPHKGENNTYVWTWMYGATKDEIGSLTSLARSWTRPPKLVIKSGAIDCQFKSEQRCYEISNSNNKEVENLKFSMQASEDSPVVNPAFVIKNWGDHPIAIKVNGKKISEGKNFRSGLIRRINQYDLVVWLELESDSKVDIILEHK